ncbi:helix-turn-helix domain-containing protein [Arsenophonus nasoniae]|uniref:helix-turn-helix domain-containing protein n=1 Tax=Arsenophonus nasoniae TaxID=638 RepID=UPI0038799C63
MLISKKIKLIRAAEKLSQSQFCKIIGIPVSTLKNLEGNYSEPNWSTLIKITKNDRFKKYTMWLMTDEINPEAGQIEPAFSLSGSIKSKTKRKVQSCLTEEKNC